MAKNVKVVPKDGKNYMVIDLSNDFGLNLLKLVGNIPHDVFGDGGSLHKSEVELICNSLYGELRVAGYRE